MSEGPSEKQESGREYEQLLQAARELKAAGVRNPYEQGPKTEAMWDSLEEWKREQGVTSLELTSMESAQATVHYARLFLDAGYTSETVRKATYELLREALDFAARGSHPAITEYLTTEIERLEPADGFMLVVEGKIAEALAQKPVSAVGTLTGLLMYPQMKLPKNAALRQQIEETRAKLKTW